MPTFTKEKWQSTRSSSCKGSGVAEAAKACVKSCPDDVKTLTDPKSIIAAIEAIDEMTKSLKTAEGKLGKEKDPVKVKNTKSLIEDWQEEAKAYKSKVTAWQKAYAEDEMEKVRAAKVLKAETACISTLDSNIDLLKDAEKLLVVVEKDIESGDAKKATKNFGIMQKKIEQVRKFGSPKMMKKTLNETAATNNVTYKEMDTGKLDGKLKTITDKMDDLEDRYDTASDAIENMDLADPDSPSKDPVYEKKFKEVLAYYKKINALLTPYVQTLQNDANQAKPLVGQADGVSDPSQVLLFVKNALTIHKTIRDHEQEAIDINFQIRDSNGSCADLKKDNGITKDVAEEHFQPFVDKSFVIFGKLSKAAKEGREAVDEALEVVATKYPNSAAKQALEGVRKPAGLKGKKITY